MIIGNVASLDWRTFDDQPGYMLAPLTLFGVSFHVEAIRVKLDEDDAQQAEADEDSLNHERLNDLSNLCGEGVFLTVKIPEHEGDWVVYITPGMD